MRETKNQKGITLIALIVTIIVLIIIAGISIATLTSDNGVLRQVNAAKVQQLEATAREQMDLACSAMRLAIAEASAKDNSYRANKNAEKIQDVLLNTVKADSTELEANSWKEGTLDAAAGTFTITYEGDDYKNACNDDNAKITYTITLAQKSIEVTDVATGIKGPDGIDTTIDVGAGSGNASGDGTGSGGESGSGSGSGTGSGSGSEGSGTGNEGSGSGTGSGSANSEVVILAEQTLNFSEDTNMGAYATQLEWGSTLALEQTYVVEWDGQKYYCYTRDIEWRNDLDTFSIKLYNAVGNAGVINTVLGATMITSDEKNEDCPFVMGTLNEGKFNLYTQDNSQTHTVKISLEITQ